jgi:redox-sensitive bicupin YhaK (pirin superfamily)
MAWIRDQGPDPIPAHLLDQIMYMGVPSTGPDGAYFPPAHDGPQAYLAVQGAQVDEVPPHFHSVEQFQYFVFVMPAAQERLGGLLRASHRRAADRRQVTVDLRHASGSAGGADQSHWVDLRHGADGFRIAVSRVSASAAVPLRTVGGSGAYVLVVNGAIEVNGTPYGAGSIAWRAAGDPVACEAGGEGARLALLQFPLAPAV